MELRSVWNSISFVLICLIAYMFKSIFTFREIATRIGVKYNSFSDIISILIILFSLIALRWSMTFFLKPMFQKRLKEVDELNYELKKNKVCKEFLSTLWYIFAVVYGNLALYNHSYIPDWLLGGGTCDGLVTNYGNYSGDDTIKKFYKLQAAHHLYSLIDHLFISKWEKDFSEMALHHLCAIAAIFFSYLTNQMALGATILLIHDYGDVLLNLGKVIRDQKLLPSYGRTLDVLFVLLFVFWFFPRVVLIGTCVIPAGAYKLHFDLNLTDPGYAYLQQQMRTVDAIQILMVFIIMLLNMYWSYVILRSGYNKIKSNGGYVIHTQGEKRK